METFANMKCNFLKVSWGIVEINDVRVYCELWLSTGLMSLKVKLKVPKGMSYSYVCSAKDCPFEDGQFLSYWVPKNLRGDTVNELVETVVEHLQLKFFEESRKWLTEKEKEVAHMLASGMIDNWKDVERMLKCKPCDLPEEFHRESFAFRKQLIRKSYWIAHTLLFRLNTYDGLTVMLRIASMRGMHGVPAISTMAHIISKYALSLPMRRNPTHVLDLYN